MEKNRFGVAKWYTKSVYALTDTMPLLIDNISELGHIRIIISGERKKAVSEPLGGLYILQKIITIGALHTATSFFKWTSKIERRILQKTSTGRS